MSNRFNEAKRLEHIAEVDRRMAQAQQQMLQFSSTVTEGIYPRWAAYLSLESDEDSIEASRAEFAAKAQSLVDECVGPLAAALDIIAGGMRDENGEPLTRQDLLDKLAGV